jgi:hypothetical protein
MPSSPPKSRAVNNAEEMADRASSILDESAMRRIDIPLSISFFWGGGMKRQPGGWVQMFRRGRGPSLEGGVIGGGWGRVSRRPFLFLFVIFQTKNEKKCAFGK